jgi:hypothetical protein
METSFVDEPPTKPQSAPLDLVPQVDGFNHDEPQRETATPDAAPPLAETQDQSISVVGAIEPVSVPVAGLAIESTRAAELFEIADASPNIAAVEPSTVEAPEASVPAILDGRGNLAASASTEREPSSEEAAQETLSDETAPSSSEDSVDVALEAEKVEASTVEALEGSVSGILDGTSSLAANASTAREPGAEEGAQKTLSDGNAPSLSEDSVDVALEAARVEASTVEDPEASAPSILDGWASLAAAASTEREPSSEEGAPAALSDGNTPSPSEDSVDLALEAEKVEASTVEAPEASVPAILDGTGGLAADASTEREPSSEEGAQATLSDGNTPSLSEDGVDLALESEKVVEADEEAGAVLEEPGTDVDSDLETERQLLAGDRHVGSLGRPRNTAPSERRPEPSTEYRAPELPPPAADYRAWNRAIAEHLLLKGTAGSDLYLTITPRILARAMEGMQGAALNAEEAEDHFTRVVAELYRDRVLTNRARLRVLRRGGDDGLPECIGFLALTVLAAYRMRGDEEATGLAYYLRVEELLHCGMSGPYPVGFDPVVFESLWFFLRDWLAQRGGRQLAMPVAEAGSRRFVGLPLAHVPLRSLDIEKLPAFFVWAGYQPSSEVATERLADDFTRWVRARSALTPTGVAAFSDARRAAVLAEIRSELESWDGTCDESVSRRSAAVEILFDPVQHRPELFYVPRCPAGFPARFDDGLRAFEGSDDGWYGRSSILPSDGLDLANGFIWQTTQGGIEFSLRRAGTSVISLAPSENLSYSGFMSARGLRRGVRCAVLCQEDVAHAAAEYLSHVAERPITPLRSQDLPVGWSLFAGVVARRLASAPAGLESLDVQANVGLIPSGGIRLGNRWSWMQGAPPRLIVTGSEPGLTVTVDGNATAVNEDGTLQSAGSLNALGTHVIQIGALQRNVEIVEPSLHATSPTQRHISVRSSAPVLLALPPGRWTVVGATPGQVARPKYGHRAGTVVECGFSPAWAIRAGGDAGATVLNVAAGVPPIPEIPRRERVSGLTSRAVRDWTSAIYDAAVRHARIESLIAEVDHAAVGASWRAYARRAGQIKRAIRGSHR